VKFPQKIEDLGIQIADFIAGYARYSANVIQKEAIKIEEHNSLFIVKTY